MNEIAQLLWSGYPRGGPTTTNQKIHKIRGHSTHSFPSLTRQAVYDYLGRLTSATPNGRTISYTYNAFGEVVSETQSAGTVSYGTLGVFDVGLFDTIRHWLRTSSHVHIRQKGVNSISDLVDLIDRFIDGSMDYDFEWDDFISWEHENHFIESVRQAIESHEPLLLAKKGTLDHVKYDINLINERNRAAAMIGLPLREIKPPGTSGNPET